MAIIKSINNTFKLVLIAMFSALAFVIMLLEIPLPFIAPTFYKLDFSEVPVFIGSFALGPISGVLIELIKIILKLIIKGTETAFVGEIANFVIGCALILPSSIIYKYKKTKKSAVISLIVSTLFMAIIGTLINAFFLLPFYSSFYGLPLDTIINMGKSIIPLINNTVTFCVFCVLPFNLIKGIIDSIITILIYKPLSNTINNINKKLENKKTE